MAKFILGVLIIAFIGLYVYYNRVTRTATPRETVQEAVDTAKKARALSSEEESLLRIQIALTDYMLSHGGMVPQSLNELVPAYFDSVPKDPRTGAVIDYTRDETGKSYRLGQAVQMASAAGVSEAGRKEITEADFVNPNLIQPETFRYDPAGKRDPFFPFDFSEQLPEGENIMPLERYTLGQLRLTAVLNDPNHGPTAIVEDSVGRGFTVRQGAKIGNMGGVVVSIEPEPKPGRLKILETQVDFTGKETERVIEMKIQPRADLKKQKKK